MIFIVVISMTEKSRAQQYQERLSPESIECRRIFEQCSAARKVGAAACDFR
jgi:hypothetical protein